MNNTGKFTNPGGLWFNQEVLKFMQEAYSGTLDGLAGLVGDKTIVSGVVNNNGIVSNGWVSYNGQLLPFTGGNVASLPFVDYALTTTDEQYDDGTQKPFYEVRTLALVAVSTNTSFPFTDLVRPQTIRSTWVNGDVKHHKCDAAYIAANFDPVTWEALPISDLYGWKIDLDAGGRVIMGYHLAATDPGGDPAWSADAHIPGNKFGEQLHQLTIAEMPGHTHQQYWTTGQNGASGNGGNIVGGNRDTSSTGGNQAHNNMQPSIVYLTLEKL